MTNPDRGEEVAVVKRVLSDVSNNQFTFCCFVSSLKKVPFLSFHKLPFKDSYNYKELGPKK